MKGKVLVINPGSTSTKIGFYEDGNQLFETNLTHSAEEIAKYDSVMDQGDMRRDAITAFLSENGVDWTRFAGTQGHVVVKVAPGGDEYRILVLDDSNQEYRITQMSQMYRSR
jgi:butyrate kinase